MKNDSKGEVIYPENEKNLLTLMKNKDMTIFVGVQDMNGGKKLIQLDTLHITDKKLD
jgi:hypothetical protein